MSDFEDRINAILGNPAEMEKIMNMASQLMGGSEKPQEPQSEQSGGAESSGQRSDGGQGPDLSGLGALGGLDFDMFSKMGHIMSQLKGGSEKTELLRAMGPYLKQERREKMEKAIRFARIAKVARAALREYGGGGDV